MKTGLCYEDGAEILLGDNVKIITGEIGKIVFERGAFGVGIQEGIDYDKIQASMDKFDRCCGNRYKGCLNDNFISLWELYWNFNCEDLLLDPVTRRQSSIRCGKGEE